MRTASMMTRKSRVDIEIYYDDGAVVLGAEGSRDAEDA